jgi:hypothetical protein
LSAELASKKPTKQAPKAVLYIQNIDGAKNKEGKVTSYFPVSRGLKTDRYTLAITIDKKTKQLKSVLLFDDLKDPYQLNNLTVDQNKKLFAALCKQMPALLKKANDPWYREQILSKLIQY